MPSTGTPTRRCWAGRRERGGKAKPPLRAPRTKSLFCCPVLLEFGPIFCEQNDCGSSRDAAPQPLLADEASTLPQLTCVAYACPSSAWEVAYCFRGVPSQVRDRALYISQQPWESSSRSLACGMLSPTRSRGYCATSQRLTSDAGVFGCCAAPFMGLSFFDLLTSNCRSNRARWRCLSGFLLACWMLVAVLFYYTAFTAFKMPSNALGVELSSLLRTTSDRVSTATSHCSTASAHWRWDDGAAHVEESLGPDQLRSVATACTSSFGLFTALIIAASVALLRESPGRHLQPRVILSSFPSCSALHMRGCSRACSFHDGCRPRQPGCMRAVCRRAAALNGSSRRGRVSSPM